MNGAQDLGGMHGFGPIDPEPDEPVFHGDWEKGVFALTLAVSFTGQWNIDMSRHARETLDPAEYLSSSYYQIWLAGLQKLLAQLDLATREEMASGTMTEAPVKVQRILSAKDVAKTLGRGGPTEREAGAEPKYPVGSAVRARNIHPPRHTRLPRYVRGHTGIIAGTHGVHVFPDTNAHGQGEQPQWLYSVRFAATELWGDDSPGTDDVYVDLWESYLDPA